MTVAHQTSTGTATASQRERPAGLRLAPSRRLVVVAAVLLVLPALAEILVDGADWVLVIAAVALVVAAALDALVGVDRAGGVRASMSPRSRLTLGRPASVDLVLRGEQRRQLRVGIALAAELGADTSEPDVLLEGAESGVCVSWRVRPYRRGSYTIDRVHLEAGSPLGLWAVRWVAFVTGEVRVYPDLRAEGRDVAALFLRRTGAGARLQRMVGRGREFEKLREYLPGDGYDEIHWKATAKRGHPVTKVFQVERTQEVYAILDASRLSGRETGATDPERPAMPILERQINAALALALAAERQGDLFGLATYADQPRSFVRARGGAAHFQACREALVSLHPEPVSPDLREVCSFLRTRLRKRALLLFLVSLDDPALAEAFVEAVQSLARHHLIVVATPRPPDAAPVFDGPAPADLPDAFARLGGHLRWQGLQDLGMRLHRVGIHHVLLERDALAAGVVSQYLALKQRQLI